MKILIVAAHPDDEVLAMGGTIARLTSQGNEVQVVFLATGMLARGISQRHLQGLQKLRQDSRRAAKLLKTRPPVFGRLPDNQLDTVPLLKVIQIVGEQIKRVEPSVIYTHWQGELNVDHQIAHRAVVTATRPFLRNVTAVYAFSVPEATMYVPENDFQPNYYVDISKTLKLKIEAMNLYSTEQRQKPHVRSSEGIKTVAAYYGFMSGLGYAEAFRLLRKIE
ncbi:MAG: PIG-L family deacetylase [Candidatus Chisholmbacteria bacterium]|nr:PIG-L family deacetylase [Candidatus Chisholmbacteria bacterium]